MLTRPDDLSDQAIREALAVSWGLADASVEHCQVGFGSHHWRAVDNAGGSWFVTVDDLAARARSAGGPQEEEEEEAWDRLRAALTIAWTVRDAGGGFAVAPIRTADGDVLARLGSRYAAAVYPYVEGRPHRFGERLPPARRQAVVELIAALHSASAQARAAARSEDFLLPGRDALTAALSDLPGPWDTGPYGEPARALLAAHATDLWRALDRHDLLAAEGRSQPERMVLTHGEPHPGNLIETSAGWKLVDWDTALVAPPERDVWLLDPGDGSAVTAYSAAAGRTVLSAMLAFYRLTWELADIAIFVSQFREPHGDTADTRTSWEALTGYLREPARRADAGFPGKEQ